MTDHAKPDEIRAQRSPHRRRTVRGPQASPIELTERDHWLLDAAGRLRFLTTGQAIRLGFAQSRSAVNKRLRSLFDAGYLRTWVRCLETENVYSLTPAGRSVLAKRSTGPQLHIPRGLDRDLEHTLAINDVRIALATTLTRLDADLAGWQSDWDLRPHRSGRVVPDARFSVRWSSGTESLFSLEVDHNTKSTTALLRKLLAYRAGTYHGNGLDGLPTNTILIVVGDQAWLDRHRLGLAHASLRLPAWFATHAEVVMHGATGEIWRSAASEQLHTLSGLVALPNGSEGQTPKTAATTGASAPAAARVSPGWMAQ